MIFIVSLSNANHSSWCSQNTTCSFITFRAMSLWKPWNTQAHEDETNGEYIGVWLLLGTSERSSTKVRLSKQNPCSESDLHQSINNAPTFLTFLMAHQYRFYNIPHILFIAFRMYPINITSSGVHHIVIPQRWKELTTQPSRIRIHITLVRVSNYE